MNGKFEPGSDDYKIAQELKDYYAKHSLMTPEIRVKFSFLHSVEHFVSKENLLKKLQIF